MMFGSLVVGDDPVVIEKDGTEHILKGLDSMPIKESMALDGVDGTMTAESTANVTITATASVRSSCRSTELAVYKNEVRIARSVANSPGPTHVHAAQAIVDLNDGDVITARIKTDKSGAAVVVQAGGILVVICG